MLDEYKWKLVNEYRRLVREDKASDFTCAHCEEHAVIMLGMDGNPAVKCFSCGSKMTPNYSWYRTIESVVREHNV